MQKSSQENRRKSLPLANGPAGDTVQFQQRVLKLTAQKFTKATKDRTVSWQRVLGPGWQLSAAMELWMTLAIDDRRELTVGYVELSPLSDAQKAAIRAAVSAVIRGEWPQKSGG